MSIEGLFGVDEWEEEDVDSAVELKFDTYERLSWRSMPDVKQVRLALVKQHHSLWAEFIYNAARVLADLIDSGLLLPDIRGKSWLELGAGAGLPSIITSFHNPSCVVISDYGNDYDRLLLPAIDHNISYAKELGVTCPIFSVGYIWGSPVERLTSCLASTGTSDPTKFDLVVMADCIFNRSEHRRLLWTVRETLSAPGLALCSFSHHDPEKTELDLAFFEIAREEFGFRVEKIYEERRESYPFVENDGLDQMRGMVYVYKMVHMHRHNETISK